MADSPEKPKLRVVYPPDLPPPRATVIKITMDGITVWEPGMSDEEAERRIRVALGREPEGQSYPVDGAPPSRGGLRLVD